MRKALSVKNKVSIVLGVVVFAVGFSGILAYLTDADSAVNKATIGGNSIEIVEEFNPPKDIAPGTSFTKDVKVSNIGSSSCYVRIKAVFEDSHMEQYCDIDWNDTVWVFDDGYWYYPKVLLGGSITPSLFTTVTIKDDTPGSKLTSFNIIVYAESVESNQGNGFTSYEQAWQNYHKNK